jgi:cell division protein FtsB
MKWLWAVLLVLIVGLQYRLWVGEGSYSQVWQLQQKEQAQREINARLAERNGRLNAEILDLKNGYQAIEEHARTDLGMIRRDETFYLVVDTTH